MEFLIHFGGVAPPNRTFRGSVTIAHAIRRKNQRQIPRNGLNAQNHMSHLSDAVSLIVYIMQRPRLTYLRSQSLILALNLHFDPRIDP